MKLKNLILKNELFDSHCHLNDKSYDEDRKQIVGAARNNGIGAIIDIAVDLESTKKSLSLAEDFEQIYPTAGIDPEVFIPGSEMFMENGADVYESFESLIALINQNQEKLIMIGETGIDMYWNRVNELDEQTFQESFEFQKELFQKHIEVAKAYELPLSIHSREAVDECIKILEGYQNENVWGVFHSITPESDDTEETFEEKLRKILDMGFYISLNGIVTYKSAELLRNTVFKILKYRVQTSTKRNLEPLDFYNAGFIFETDGPYLAPEGKRGERNEPGNVKDVFEFLTSFFLDY